MRIYEIAPNPRMDRTQWVNTQKRKFERTRQEQFRQEQLRREQEERERAEAEQSDNEDYVLPQNDQQTQPALKLGKLSNFKIPGSNFFAGMGATNIANAIDSHNRVYQSTPGQNTRINQQNTFHESAKKR